MVHLDFYNTDAIWDEIIYFCNSKTMKTLKLTIQLKNQVEGEKMPIERHSKGQLAGFSLMVDIQTCLDI